MYRFFVGQSQIDPEQKKISITGSDVNHIKNVVEEWKPTVVVDVHNSTACANTVLISFSL